MYIYYDSNKQPKQSHVYLASPNNKILCALNGIDESSFDLTLNLNNTSTLSFDLNKYVTVVDRLSMRTKEVKSNGYDLMDVLMRLYVDGIGWFIIDSSNPPSISHDGTKETKNIQAQSAEIEMQQHDLKNYKINQGTTDSYEMFADDNVEIIDDVEFAKEQIKFYNPENPQLSLLDLSLQTANMKGWSIGYIDTVPKTYQYYEDGELKEKQTLLADEIGQFDIESQDLYSFFTQDMAQFFQCIFVFDYMNMTISAYHPENLGTDTNININFRNLEQSHEISVNTDNIFTRYYVQGSDDLGIEYVNFGSNYIEDLSYYLNEKYMEKDLIEKYTLWSQDVEIKRLDYIENTRLYNKQINVISELYDRVPLDDCSTDWSTFTDEELYNAKSNYEAQLKGYESFYVDDEGNFDEEALKASVDANDYYQIKDVILPSIEIEMNNRELPTDEDKEEYIDTFKTDWKLYGLDELQVKLDEYKDTMTVCEKGGYDVPYSDESGHTKDTHDKMYQEYIDAKNHLDPDFSGSCQEAYNQRKQEIDTATTTRDEYDKNRKEAAKSYNKETWAYEKDEETISFTTDELRELSLLYVDGDYSNENMFLVDSDDQTTAIDEQLKLLKAAQDDMYIAAHPQYQYSTDVDNFIAKYDYKNYTENLNCGDYIYLGLDDDNVVKLRVVTLEYNPMTMDNNLQITFSDMVQSTASRNDSAFLFNLASGGSKSSAAGSSKNFLNNEGVTLTAGLIQKLIANRSFSNGVSNIVSGNIGNIINGSNILKVIDNDVFLDYVQAKLISADKVVADNAEFKKLSALVAMIDNLLVGNVSAETAHIIKLTADNVAIDEAVIKNLIAAQITVSMLQAGDINTDKFHVKSDDGTLEIIGNTMKFMDKNGVVRIQIGRDANDDFTFCLYDETGKGILIDSTGVKESAISDGLIKNDMISDGTIAKEKLSFNIVEGDENGNVDVKKVIMNGEGIDVEFSSIREDIEKLNTTMTGVSSKVDANEKSIKDEVWKNSVITVKDADGNDVKKTLENILVNNTTDINGTRTEIENVKSIIGNEDDENSNTIIARLSNVEVTADNVKQSLQEDYFSKDEINSSFSSEREATARMISDSVENNITGEGSYVNQQYDSIEQVIGEDLFVKVRYVRDWLFSNDIDSENRFVECKVLDRSGKNLAYDVMPKAYTEDLTEITDIENLNLYTDGQINEDEYIYNPNCCALVIDLGSVKKFVKQIQVYHYYKDGRKNKHKLEISENGVNWITLYDSTINGEYTETADGKLNEVQTESVSNQITAIRQNLDSINLLAQKNSQEYAQLLIQQNNLSTTVSSLNDEIKAMSNMVQDSGGWKFYMKQIGAYNGTDIDDVETCISMDAQDGISVTSSAKAGYKTSLMPDELAGFYDDGINGSQQVFSVNGKLTWAERFRTTTGVDFNEKMKIIPAHYTNNGNSNWMLAFVKGGGES